MGARYYAPWLGAFTQVDTHAGSAANPASMNRFLYAEANPATLIDPTGHMACNTSRPSCAIPNLGPRRSGQPGSCPSPGSTGPRLTGRPIRSQVPIPPATEPTSSQPADIR